MDGWIYKQIYKRSMIRLGSKDNADQKSPILWYPENWETGKSVM